MENNETSQPPGSVNNESLRPFEPYAAGINALLLSPIAGALLSFVNLKRLGHPAKAKRILTYTIPASIVEFFILMRLPHPYARYFGIGVAIAAYKVFVSFQEKEVAVWKLQNPGSKPRGFWSGFGWFILGAAATLAVSFPMAYLLDSLGL